MQDSLRSLLALVARFARCPGEHPRHASGPGHSLRSLLALVTRYARCSGMRPGCITPTAAFLQDGDIVVYSQEYAGVSFQLQSFGLSSGREIISQRKTHSVCGFFMLIPFILIFSIGTGTLAAEDHSRITGDEIPRGNFAVQARVPLTVKITPALRSTLNSAEIAAFIRNGEIIYRHKEHFFPELLIGDAAAAQQLSRDHAEKKNNIAIEILMALELAPTLAGEDLELHIFNVLHRVSTLSGLEYFSASRGHMREFYLTSSVVDETDGRTPLPDPVFSHVQRSYRFVMRQEDASFGDNLYEVRTSPGIISIQNLSPMFYSIIPIAEPGDLELQIRIHREGEHLLFYAFSSMKAPDIFGLQERVRNSFYNRMVALYNWFARELKRP